MIEEQPPEILDKSSLWLQPIIAPDESQLTCLPQWTAGDPSPSVPSSNESKWNNLLSPPQVHTGPPFDLQSMSTEEIGALTNEIPVLSKTKTKAAKFVDTPRGKTPFQNTPNKSSSNSLQTNPLSTFRNKCPLDSTIGSPLSTPQRAVKKLPPLLVSNGQSSTRPRRAAAIKADERIQQIRHADPDENSPSVLSIRTEKSHGDSIDLLIDQIERKLQFDDDDDDGEEQPKSQRVTTDEELKAQCWKLHDRLAYAPSAKLMRYIVEYLIILSGDDDPWLIGALITEIQAIGFRYNALCIYQRKQR